MYNNCHTVFDVMKEFLITGAELDGKYQMPMIPACSFDYLPEDSIDFLDKNLLEEDEEGNKIIDWTAWAFNNPVGFDSKNL